MGGITRLFGMPVSYQHRGSSPWFNPIALSDMKDLLGLSIL
jgi:hypothetical protein